MSVQQAFIATFEPTGGFWAAELPDTGSWRSILIVPRANAPGASGNYPKLLASWSEPLTPTSPPIMERSAIIPGAGGLYAWPHVGSSLALFATPVSGALDGFIFDAWYSNRDVQPADLYGGDFTYFDSRQTLAPSQQLNFDLPNYEGPAYFFVSGTQALVVNLFELVGPNYLIDQRTFDVGASQFIGPGYTQLPALPLQVQLSNQSTTLFNTVYVSIRPCRAPIQ